MTVSTGSRPAAVAGLFYSADPAALSAEVRGHLAAGATRVPHDLAQPAAIICPHAGYRYSGPIAGTAFAAASARTPARVIIIGPAHRVAFHGISAAGVATYATPLGPARVDTDAVEQLVRAGHVTRVPAAHANEHCLEVMLPFIREAFGDVPVVPLLVGRAQTAQVAAALDALLRPDDLLVVSTDLSHFLTYDVARERDRATLDAILAGEANTLGPHDACGHRGVAGAMAVAAARGWSPTLLDYRNSGDTAGDKRRVVGYGALSLG